MNRLHTIRNRTVLILFLFIRYMPCTNAQTEPEVVDFQAKTDTLVGGEIAPLPQQAIVRDTLFNRLPLQSQDIAPVNKKIRKTPVNIYDLPYSKTDNYPNYRRLALNTGVLYGAGIAALGVLQLLPEDATSWNKEEITSKPFFKRWYSNVRKGPVWDKDNFMFNFVLHPYGGAAYYMSARSQGCNQFYSYLYCVGISTLFWEYGIEAFMEIPSIQDLIITPTTGLLLGEAFYVLKRRIVSNEYRLWGSRFLGNMVAYIIDPVNEVIGIFAGNPNRQKIRKNKKRNSVACTSFINPFNPMTKWDYGLTISF